MLSDKTILITGGTGSFGHQLMKTVREGNFKEVRIFSRDELKQETMRVELNDPRVKFYLGDVRDRSSIDAAMRGVDLVFHAAALKQVPSCEFFPMQAVLTNITGSHNVIESAVAHGVGKVVCLSTDKAVMPINAMGMTKALMEKVAQAAARQFEHSDTTICSVRYGNVMYSRGSVIPLFVRQVKQGKPLTITDPDMTRFLLSLRDAIDLVLFAFEHAGQGDILIRKASASTVADLATAIKNLFEVNVPTQSIGVRHGEKIYETLATKEELLKSDDLGDYFRVHMDNRDLNYAKYFAEGTKLDDAAEEYNSHNTHRLDVAEVERLLLTLPEIEAELEQWKRLQRV